jgi:hypothetical protein
MGRFALANAAGAYMEGGVAGMGRSDGAGKV